MFKNLVVRLFDSLVLFMLISLGGELACVGVRCLLEDHPVSAFVSLGFSLPMLFSAIVMINEIQKGLMGGKRFV